MEIMEPIFELNARKLFDSYAENYGDFLHNALAMEQRQRIYQQIEGYLRCSKTLLDLGCGPGADFEFYSRFNLKVDAIDISPGMVEKARSEQSRTGLNARVLHSSLSAFTPEISYDFILLNFGVINAIGDLDMALAKLKSWLNPEGILAIISMPPFHLAWVLENLTRLRFKPVLQRLKGKKAVLQSGIEIHYYRGKDFLRAFRLLKCVPLGAALPTPEQYQRWRLARQMATKLMPLDRFLSQVCAEGVGGDHICYILTHRKREGDAHA